MITNLKRNLVKCFSKVSLFFALLLASVFAQAQVNLTNLNPYTQNFDGLPQSGSFSDNASIPGWYISLNGSKAITGGDGNITTAGIRNFSSAGSTDRALGGVTSSATGEISYSVKLKNTTGSDINSFIVSYNLEEWRGMQKEPFKIFGVTLWYTSVYGNLAFEYQIGNGAWIPVSELTMAGKVAGSNDADLPVDGNANKTNLNAVIKLANGLARNAEITLRWKRPNEYAGNYMAIDDVSITPIAGNIYFSTSGTGNLTNTSNWGTDRNGGGTRPSSMSINNATFVFVNRSTTTLNATWNLGTNSKLIVAEGNLTISANTSRRLSGVVDVMNGATLMLENATLPTLGILGDLSTINFNSSSATIPSRDYGNLTISNGKKNISASLRVKNKLTLNSQIELGNHDLILDENATIDNASSTNFIITNGNGSVKQTVKAGNVLFPVGTTASDYQPVTLSNAGTADVFSVKVIEGIYARYNNNVPDASVPITENAYNKTWLIDEDVTGGSNVTLTVEGRTSIIGGLLNIVGGLTGFDINQAKIVHYENNKWDYSPSLPTLLNTLTGRYTMSRNGITSFSPFSKMSGTPTPLPVELVSFAAKRDGNGIVCSWKTAQELKNDFFTVERSSDGREFTEAGVVKGKGTTAQASVYTFTDHLAPAALTYYRLKQTDFDGTTSYSKIVAVSANAKATAGFELYPNPSAGQSVLQSVTEIAEPAAVTILNAQGQVVKNLTVNPSDLRAGVKLDLVSEPAGVYFLQIIVQHQVTNLRLVKQ